MKIRTDLALECRELQPQDLPGVHSESRQAEGLQVTTVRVENQEGARALGKPIGSYITLELPPASARFGSRFDGAVRVLAESLAPLLPPGPKASTLVVGLGNPQITPDSLGPETLKRIIKTRHLVVQAPEHFGEMRPVAALEPGVLATTGVETAELVRAVTDRLRPDCVLVVDALASRRLARVCRTVQLSDSGIRPGSGVGNARAELSRESLGMPVLALGVPTVVDAATLAADLAEQAGLGEQAPAAFSGEGADMIVTPKDIDSEVADIAKLLAYGINMALHPGLSIDDIDAFLD